LLWHSKTYSQNKTIDSLEAELPQASGRVRLAVVQELFAEFIGENDIKKSVFYAEMFQRLAKESKDTLWMVKAGNALGYIRDRVGRLNEAVKIYEEALQLVEIKLLKEGPQIKDFKRLKKFLLNNVGSSYARLAYYDKALDFHLKSLKFREQEMDTFAIAVALNNVGFAFKELGDYDNALSYFKRSYNFQLKTNDDFEIEIRLNNIADASNQLGLYEETIQYMEQVFSKCAKKNCEPRAIAFAHHTNGYALLKLNRLEEAESEFRTALKMFQDINDIDEIIELNAIAEVKFEQGDYKRALEYLEESQELASQTDYLKYQLKNFRLFSQVYRRLKDYKLSAEYQTRYSEAYEKIFNTDLIRNVARIQSEYLEEENLATIERQGSEIELNKELIRAQRNQVIFFTAVCVLVIGLVFILWRFTLAQRKSNLALVSAKSTIEQKNNELTDINRTLDERILIKTRELVNANVSLQRSNEELDHFIYKTSHDIRGPLASLKGIASLALIESKDEEVTRYIRMLDETAEGLIKILTRMVSISQITHAKVEPQNIDFQVLVADALSIQNKRGAQKKLSIEQSIDPRAILISDKTLLGIILDNLLDNAVKFQNTSERTESFVKIKVAVIPTGIEIAITDNGIGFDKANAEKVFQMFVRASEKSETGGLGLYLTRLAVEKIGGTIALHITDEKWTEFRIVLPPDLRVVLEERSEAEIQHEMDQLKFRLMAMSSHEMRTPLTSIKASAESLALRLKQSTGEERLDIKRNIDRIIAEVNRVTEIIDEILKKN